MDDKRGGSFKAIMCSFHARMLKAKFFTDDGLMGERTELTLKVSINYRDGCPMMVRFSLEYTLSLVVPAGRWRGSFERISKMDAR